MSTEPRNDAARVWKLMEQINVCMLASKDGDKIRARPMHPTAREPENAIYFLTSTDGHTDDELQNEDEVCLSFAEPDNGKYLVVTGRARILEDRPLIHELWSIGAEAWWDGPDDPRVRAIEVTPEDAQFWDGPHGATAMVQLTLAAATGAKPDMGDQRKVDLH